MTAQDRKPGTSEVDAKPDDPKPARPTPAPGETKGTASVEAKPDRPAKAEQSPKA